MSVNIVPREMLWFIFGYAGPSSFGIFRLVCQQWKRVIDSDEFKRYFDQRDEFNNELSRTQRHGMGRICGDG